MKSFLDRAFFVASYNGSLLRHKVGAGVVAARRSGGSASFDQLNKYFLISEMTVVGSCYWNIIHGLSPGEASQDLEGMEMMANAWPHHHAAIENLKSSAKRVWTNGSKAWSHRCAAIVVSGKAGIIPALSIDRHIARDIQHFEPLSFLFMKHLSHDNMPGCVWSRWPERITARR